ncbi:hypothetical protein RMATCC62417_18152 [Rhizopus microsporus]|nr:hypothetical protein RMATCC62417_18152 [Rhizopus microsporus]
MSSPKKIAVQLSNTCYLCERSYSTPASLNKHLKSIHHAVVTSRKNFERRPPSTKYEFKHYNGDPDIPIHHACSSCFYHTANINSLKDHILKDHRPVYLESEGEENEEEESEGEENKGEGENEAQEDQGETSNGQGKNLSVRRRSLRRGKSSSADTLANNVLNILVDKLHKLMRN